MSQEVVYSHKSSKENSAKTKNLLKMQDYQNILQEIKNIYIRKVFD